MQLGNGGKRGREGGRKEGVREERERGGCGETMGSSNRISCFMLFGLRDILYYFKTYFLSSSQTYLLAGNDNCSFSSN